MPQQRADHRQQHADFAEITPRRAVAGEFIHFNGENKSRRRRVCREPGIKTLISFLRLPLLEHLQHAVGDQIAADHVDGRRATTAINPNVRVKRGGIFFAA
jgi:hypothetical protein